VDQLFGDGISAIPKKWISCSEVGYQLSEGVDQLFMGRIRKGFYVPNPGLNKTSNEIHRFHY
jgi:hypothetical protein